MSDLCFLDHVPVSDVYDPSGAMWKDRIAELEADLAKAKRSNKGMHVTIERLTERSAHRIAELQEEANIRNIRINELEADVYAQALAKHHALDTVQAWEQDYGLLLTRNNVLSAKLDAVIGELTVLTDWIHRGFSADDAATEIKAIVERESGGSK